MRRRFKRVGPNAMRGRGIGTARGRATIMRGTLYLYILDFACLTADSMISFTANGKHLTTKLAHL